MSTTVYVGAEKIGDSIEEDDIRAEFEKFGAIAKIWVARKPSGFGFVEFEDTRDAEDVSGITNKYHALVLTLALSHSTQTCPHTSPVAHNPATPRLPLHSTNSPPTQAVKEMDGKEIRGETIKVELSRRGSGNDRQSEVKPGDWACPQCRVNNFAKR
jgi:RNA recognition motif-containing protein